jgi:ribosomal protein L40E
MKCPKCGTENPEKEKFRKKCGQSLLTELICNRCQNSNPVDSEFCVECGQALTSTQPPFPVAFQPETPVKPTPHQPNSFELMRSIGADGWVKRYEEKLEGL